MCSEANETEFSIIYLLIINKHNHHAEFNFNEILNYCRSCTCYGATAQSRGDPGVLFEATPHCDVVQGTLYSCLRALFGTSVAGILVCIFSCMLLYQLLSHEKKKMYWEQLELRCRSLYGQGGAVRTVAGSCGCCSDCGGTSPWWAQTPGNLYTPNPDMAPSRYSIFQSHYFLQKFRWNYYKLNSIWCSRLKSKKYTPFSERILNAVIKLWILGVVDFHDSTLNDSFPSKFMAILKFYERLSRNEYSNIYYALP